MTEIYDYLRLLYARIGKAYCPTHKVRIQAQTSQAIYNKAKEVEKGDILILSPIARQKKGAFEQELKDLYKEGFLRARVDGKIIKTGDKIVLDKNKKHDVEAIIDSVNISEESRIIEAIEVSAKKSDGLVIIKGEGEEIFSTKLSCPVCGYSLPEMEPRMFSLTASRLRGTQKGLGVDSLTST